MAVVENGRAGLRVPLRTGETALRFEVVDAAGNSSSHALEAVRDSDAPRLVELELEREAGRLRLRGHASEPLASVTLAAAEGEPLLTGTRFDVVLPADVGSAVLLELQDLAGNRVQLDLELLNLEDGLD